MYVLSLYHLDRVHTQPILSVSSAPCLAVVSVSLLSYVTSRARLLYVSVWEGYTYTHGYERAVQV